MSIVNVGFRAHVKIASRIVFSLTFSALGIPPPFRLSSNYSSFLRSPSFYYSFPFLTFFPSPRTVCLHYVIPTQYNLQNLMINV